MSPGIIRSLQNGAEDTVERMVVKSAFKPPSVKVIAMKPIDRPRTNKVPMLPLAFRDRVLFYVDTVSKLSPSGQQAIARFGYSQT